MTVQRCSALRRDGQPCGALASSPDAVYCRHHERLVKLHGEDAIREGRYPRKRDPQSETPIVVTESNGENGNVPLAPRPGAGPRCQESGRGDRASPPRGPRPSRPGRGAAGPVATG
jgi:hypothetical protein